MQPLLTMLILNFLALPLAADFHSGIAPHPDWENSLKPVGVAGTELTLAEDGATTYRIVLPANPTTQEEKAAQDLMAGLALLSNGVSFPLVHEDANFIATGREISIGKTNLWQQSDLPEKQVDMKNEGYAISVTGETLFIFGGKWRGPLYGVSAFLEEDLGFRWYVRNSTTFVLQNPLIVRPVARTFVPQLERRDPYLSDAHDVDWSLYNKTSSHHVPVPMNWGGYPKFPMHFVHTYNTLMPPKEFYADHPEYFAEVEGERIPSQLCPTNPDVQRIMAERVLNRLHAQPDSRYVDVSPNDWRGYCACSTCAALDTIEDSTAASLLMLVNHVADAVAEQFTEVQVTTLAYLGTFMPPKTVRPRPNVQITLCTDSHAWDYIFLNVTDTTEFMAALEQWTAIGANLMIWDYPIDFYRYMRPTPNMKVIETNNHVFFDHGVKGVIQQASHGGNFGIDRARIRAWVWAKTLWDPSRDSETLTRDFYYGFFGHAAPPLYEYHRLLESKWEEAHAQWIPTHPQPSMHDKDEYEAVFFPLTVDFQDDFIAESMDLFKQAETIATGNPELLQRIEYEKLALLYIQAEQFPWQQGKQQYLTLLNEFERIARREQAFFTRDAYEGHDLDRRLAMWRALAQIDTEKTQYSLLNPEWNFKPDPDVVGVNQKWYASDLDDSDWGTVRSDLGHKGWESQGYAEYTEGYGWYRQAFCVPDEFHLKPNPRMFFGQVDEQAEVWLNGTKVYAHTTENLNLSKDFLWNLPFHFDPTEYLIPGKQNQLTVRVHNGLHVGGIVKPVALVWGEIVEDLRVLREYIDLHQKSLSTNKDQSR